MTFCIDTKHEELISVTQNNDTQHNNTAQMLSVIKLSVFIYCYAECRYAECRYAERHGATINYLIFAAADLEWLVPGGQWYCAFPLSVHSPDE